MRSLSDVGMESRKARVRLQFPSAGDAAGFRIFETAGEIRTPARGAHRQFAEVCQPAMADDGRATARGFGQGRGSKKPGQHGGSGGSRGGSPNPYRPYHPNHKTPNSPKRFPSSPPS